MYQLVKAIAIQKGLNTRWVEVDLSNELVLNIYNKYRKVYLELSNPDLAENVYLDMEVIKETYNSFTGTLTDLIISFGNNVLETLDEIPELNPKHVTYTDAFRANYKIDVCNINYAYGNFVPDELQTDVIIYRNLPQTDMQVFHDNCLVSINGYLHKTDTDGNFVYIKDGAKSLKRSNKNQIGFLNFINVGKIEQVKITPDMLSPSSLNDSLRNGISINLDKPLENKTVILSIGGYLQFSDPLSFYMSGDKTFTYKFDKLKLLNRYFESQDNLDFESLGLAKTPNNINLIDVDEFLSDEVLTKYLTLPMSFFIIVDNPSIFTEKIFIKKTNLPGMFISHIEPKIPLFVSNGRLAEYWKVYEDGQWAVNVSDSYLRNFMFNTVTTEEVQVISNSLDPNNMFYNSNGFLLKIGSDF
jgi:hypothetical protein